MHTLELSRKEIILIMAGAMLTLLLAALDNTIVGTAMPKIIRDLHGMEHYSWPFTAYMLCSTVILPISGKLADIYGRKKITLFGISFFIIASAMCGLSSSMIELSILRGLQGIGGGVCISSSFIIVSEIFPPKKRIRYIGLVTSMFAVASILGPAAGGIITDSLTWRYIFFINIPLGLIAFFMLAKFFPNIKHHTEKRNIDLYGMTLFLATMFPLLYAISRLGSADAEGEITALLFIFSAVIGTLFMFVEKKSAEPLLSLHFFREKVFTSSVIASSFGNMAIFGASIYMPLYLQSVRGISATRSGFIMMPMMVSMILASNLSGIITSKFTRYKPIAIFGLVLSFTGIFCFGFFGNRASIPLIIIFTIMAGAGIGSTFPIFTIAPQCINPHKLVGVISSLLQFFRSLGGTLGAALFGALMISRINREIIDVSSGNLPENISSLVKNPGILSNPERLAIIRGGLPAVQLENFDRTVSSCLKIVSGSIETVFLVSSLLLLVSIISVTLYFDEDRVKKEIEERRRHH